ncbi:MAG: glycosyltransferase family 39 protein [Flavobacteriales bacterium]|nr:glycosyltransferase family 39 protein [Flavobacteriales bacterium]
MRRPFTPINALLVLLLALALLGWWGSGLSYATVSAHLNHLAQDGLVETYDGPFHARIQGNLRALAGIAIVGLLVLLVFRKRIKASKVAVESVPASGVRAGIRGAWREYTKRTSSAHKRFVLVLILGGAALRAMLMLQPITYDEAFTFTYYATRPIHVIVSDYSYPNNHIFHTLLVKLSTLVFGVGKVSLRLPAFMAGVVVLPLFYFFVRAMFNRYIALMALAMLAASGPLLEYGACARGYSLTWLFMVMALLLGRHFIKTNSTASAAFIGAACALGMWTVPTMIYAALTIHIWLLISLTAKYENSLRERILNLLLSLSVFVVFTVLLYLPVILVHGFDQLLHHSTLPERDWQDFTLTHQDHALLLWAHIVDSSAAWVGILGFIGMVHATFISSKFRFLVMATLLGAVPLVVAQAAVVPPRAWLYLLFIFHLSSAIALFYLLKFIQEKLWSGFGKRERTVVASILLFIGFAIPGYHISKIRLAGMPEAGTAAAFIQRNLVSDEKVYIDYPWDSPIEFHLMALGVDRSVMYGPASPTGRTFVAVGPDYEQTLEGVLAHHDLALAAFSPFDLVQDQRRLKIFAAPMR